MARILSFGLQEMLMSSLKHFRDCHSRAPFVEQCPLGQMPFSSSNASYIM